MISENNQLPDMLEECAKKEGVTVSEFCAGIEETIDVVMQSDEPSAKTLRSYFQWKRPTVEEFIDYMVRETKRGVDDQR